MVLKLHLEVGIIIVMDIFVCTTFCYIAHSSKQQLMNFLFYSIKYMWVTSKKLQASQKFKGLDSMFQNQA